MELIKTYDKRRNLIYLTNERWYHIIDTHPEMKNFKKELIETIKKGRRKQDPFDQTKYKYYKQFHHLEKGFSHIIAIVKFKTINENNNNFVLTAYQVFIYGGQS